MRVVAYAEIAIALRVLLGALMFRNSFITPFIYLHFVRMRYFQSAFSKEAVHTVAFKIADFVDKPGVPPVVQQVWLTVQALIGRWTGATLPQRTAPAAAR